MKYESQLSESLRELQPCKETIKQLQDENGKYLLQVNELETKLVAGEKLAQQYEALLKSKEQKDKNYVEKDELDKQVAKKEREIKTMKEKIAKINEKLHDRISCSQKLVKNYKTSVKHLLKFGKKLTKQENASKSDQKIIEHYNNIISKAKNFNETDDYELEMPELYEETYADSSNSSFEVVEEIIISSPYKRTPTKTLLNDVLSSPLSNGKQTSKNLDEVIHPEPFSQLNGQSLEVVSQCKSMEETKNAEGSCGMPVINESDMQPQTMDTNSEPFSQLNGQSLEVVLQCKSMEETKNAEGSCGMPVINESDMQPQTMDTNSEKPLMDNSSNLHGVKNEASTVDSKLTNNNSSNLSKIEQKRHINKEITLSKVGNSLQEERGASHISDDIPYNELEEEIARITFDMCSQGMPFHPLSPIPPTPPPNHINNGNFSKFEEGRSIVYCSAERSPRKKKRHLFLSNERHKKHAFDGAVEHTNGTHKLHHQQSEGFEVLSDDINYSTPNGNGQFSQSSENQTETSTNNSSTGNQFSSTPLHDRQTPETSQQPFQANILHCPIDGNFKINICMGNFPNETQDHKITSLNLEVNNVTREFNISCSRVSCELKNNMAETTCPCCPHNYIQKISSTHEVTETGSRPNGKACNLFTRIHPSRDKIKPVTPSPSRPMYSPAETCHSAKLSKVKTDRMTDLTEKTLHPFTKEQQLPSNKLKVQNISDMECPQSFTDKIKQSGVKQMKILPPFSSNATQKSILCAKETRPSLSKQKSIPFVEQTKVGAVLPSKQKSENPNLQIIRNKAMEIFPISHKDANNKRPLSGADESSVGDGKTESSSGQAMHLSKKCRLSLKTNEVPTDHNALVDQFWKLGRNIYDVKSSIQKTMEEIQRVKSGSEISLKNLQSKLANPNHILSTDTFVHSAVLFLANTRRNVFTTFSQLTPKPPLMTDFETNLVAVVQFLQAKGYNHLKNLIFGLKIALSASIFTRGKRIKLFGTASMCRVYIALCRQCGELEQARLLCYDLFCNLPDNAVFLVTAAVAVWPDILNTDQSVGQDLSCKRDFLQVVYVYLLLNGKHTLNETLSNQCLTVLKKLFNLSSSFNDIITLGKQFVDVFEDGSADVYNCPDINSKLSEACMAIELLAMQARLLSQVKEFFDNLLMPIFTKWQSQFTKKEKNYETLLPFWLKVFGVAGYQCFQTEKCYLENIMKLLTELLVTSDMPVAVQESAFISLLTLQPLSNISYLQNVADWLLKHEQQLSDEGKAFVQKVNLKLVLETFHKKNS